MSSCYVDSLAIKQNDRCRLRWLDLLTYYFGMRITTLRIVVGLTPFLGQFFITASHFFSAR